MALSLGKHLKGSVLAIALLAGSPAAGEDEMVLGPRQFETEKSGRGAVLCIWSIYLSMQADAIACKFSPEPVDEAVAKAIASIDEFILANSSLRPTRTMLDHFKRRAVTHTIEDLQRSDLAKHCEGTALYFRRASPEQIKSSVESLLSVPREPVMNPCL